MKYYIIAGESSGDLHAANLMSALQKIDAQAEFRFWGGDHMLLVSPKGLVKHIKELAFMGFIEVLLNLRTILKNLRLAKQDIVSFMPDAVVFIDYPGFNLRMAQFCKEKGLKTIYYISPQLWAWKENRIKIIHQYVDQMYVILPFEEKFYTDRGYKNASYVGHPLLDELEKRNLLHTNKKMNQVAVLPGSRIQEIQRMLPMMSAVFTQFPDHQFIICAVPHIALEEYQKALGASNVEIKYGQTYEVLASSSAALVTSGTATLETALFDVPQVVCYKANRISYFIAKKLIKVKYISLVNLILDQGAVQELIQDDCSPEKISTALKNLLWNDSCKNDMKESYTSLRKKMGEKGCSHRVALNIFNYIQ